MGMKVRPSSHAWDLLCHPDPGIIWLWTWWIYCLPAGYGGPRLNSQHTGGRGGKTVPCKSTYITSWDSISQRNPRGCRDAWRVRCFHQAWLTRFDLPSSYMVEGESQLLKVGLWPLSACCGSSSVATQVHTWVQMCVCACTCIHKK